jgi:5-(carboxyamino)imidazole ribonucleotide mutase
MPGGVPVATVAINGAKNAGLLAAQIVGTSDEKVAKNLDNYKKEMEQNVLASAKKLSVEK